MDKKKVSAGPSKEAEAAGAKKRAANYDKMRATYAGSEKRNKRFADRNSGSTRAGADEMALRRNNATAKKKVVKKKAVKRTSAKATKKKTVTKVTRKRTVKSGGGGGASTKVKTGSNTRTRQTARVAAKVSSRSGLTGSAARKKARSIIKKRK